MCKTVLSKGLVFRYDSRVAELFFVSGEKFLFNNERGVFEIDRDPLGDGDLRPIANIAFDGGSFEFDAELEDVAERYRISSRFAADNVLDDFLRECVRDGFHIPDADEDVGHIEFDRRRLTRVKLIKVEAGVAEDFLTIYSDPGESFLIKYPQQRMALDELSFDRDELVCRTPGGRLVWKLELQPAVRSLVRSIIESDGR